MKMIDTIKNYNLDRDGNNDNFWVLVEKINEIIEVLNSEANSTKDQS